MYYCMQRKKRFKTFRQDKSNQLLDRRFGEDPTLSKRFVIEKKVQSLHQYIQY